MAMQWFQWTALGSIVICLSACILHIIRLVRSGLPTDYSRPAAKTNRAIFFAFTGAMSPARKESAYLHLPTYTAGLFYHMGTFLSFFLFFFILTGRLPHYILSLLFTIFLFISSLSGTAILVKRMVRKELRSLSNPDDFISNILVTLFQILTISILIFHIVQLSNRPTVQLSYYLLFTLMMLYVPVGKLRHMVYFFAARIHLGYFFGRRGVWPVQKIKK
jgi:hypothetical protein